MGELVPIGTTEVLPGDTLQQATSALVRASPLLAPVMHPVHVRVHHWFVPYRLVWEDWEDFITGGPDGDNSSTFPTITFGGGTGADVGSLADYLGVVPSVDGLEVSALPFRAYNLIYNNWYRDQDLETEAAISVASGADSTTDTDLLSCAWEKDYFTSARPWEQKGPAINIPLGTTAPVTVTQGTDGEVTDAQIISKQQSGGGLALSGTSSGASTNATLSGTADLSNASTITVNALREAMGLQRYEEARARYGSRYTEYLRYWGVKSSDARLQRPEYLGGGKQTIQFSEVLQTAEGTDPVGELRGHGIGALKTNRYRRYFEEHGIVLTLMSVRPKTIYTQGLNRSLNRRTKEDFFQPELAHIGQQEVLNKEVYAAHTTPEGVFGYQDRYDEYRRNESTVAGEFRTSTLDYWHLAREFGSDPALNASFVSCVPSDRIFAVNSTDTLWVMAKHSIQARRYVSKLGKSYIY